MKNLLFILMIFMGLYSCQNKKKEADKDTDSISWIGSWQMVGYDNISVADSSTIIFMHLKEDNSIIYTTETREGEVLISDTGEYKMNDMHSVLSIYEGQRMVMEYFIRKLDRDSLIFESDTFSIKWKRID